MKGSDQTTETSSFPEHVHVCQSIFFGVGAAYNGDCTVNSRELVLVLGMVTVLVVCREKDSQVFP